MESKSNEMPNTPRKFHNILLERAVQGKFYPFSTDSPFRCLPPASTPPSRIAKIKNPFESYSTERQHQTVFSPTVFNRANSKTEEKFRWGIEDISHLKPVNIDETTVEQFESFEHDIETESLVQANIEQFFNGKNVVTSPFNVVLTNVPLIEESPIDQFKKETADGATQTMLTLPPVLPTHIEEVLKPYFSFTTDEDHKNSSLYLKLFEYDEQRSPSSALTSPAPSCNLSPIEFSPTDDNVLKTRNFGSQENINDLSHCALSPIDENHELHRNERAVHYSFIEKMNVDTSINVIPEVSAIPSDCQSVAFDTFEVPLKEAPGNSSANWDVERKRVSLCSPSSQSRNDNEMDISSSITPKSKIFTSQRKKLSDSFLRIPESDGEDDNEENIQDFVRKVRHIKNDTADAGYHTGSGLPASEESWGSPNLFASTPTKHQTKQEY